MVQKSKRNNQQMNARENEHRNTNNNQNKNDNNNDQKNISGHSISSFIPDQFSFCAPVQQNSPKRKAKLPAPVQQIFPCFDSHDVPTPILNESSVRPTFRICNEPWRGYGANRRQYPKRQLQKIAPDRAQKPKNFKRCVQKAEICIDEAIDLGFNNILGVRKQAQVQNKKSLARPKNKMTPIYSTEFEIGARVKIIENIHRSFGGEKIMMKDKKGFIVGSNGSDRGGIKMWVVQFEGFLCFKKPVSQKHLELLDQQQQQQPQSSQNLFVNNINNFDEKQNKTILKEFFVADFDALSSEDEQDMKPALSSKTANSNNKFQPNTTKKKATPIYSTEFQIGASSKSFAKPFAPTNNNNHSGEMSNRQRQQHLLNNVLADRKRSMMDLNEEPSLFQDKYQMTAQNDRINALENQLLRQEKIIKQQKEIIVEQNQIILDEKEANKNHRQQIGRLINNASQLNKKLEQHQTNLSNSADDLIKTLREGVDAERKYLDARSDKRPFNTIPTPNNAEPSSKRRKGPGQGTGFGGFN